MSLSGPTHRRNESNLTQGSNPASETAFYQALESALGHRIPRPEQDGESAQPIPLPPCRLTIVVPALNEEEAIGRTLQDILKSREEIIRRTVVTEVLVVVVNDGSTDGTRRIAEEIGGVEVINFPKNRGYGAAIKAGFRANTSELVGFIDADGTLQSGSFIPMINALFEQRADVVLGARLNEESQMPLIRRIGNWGFARLLGYISGKCLTDSASGMRVIRRSSLKYLMPLPDGLHFTPAMSCNAILDRRLKLCEVPVPYAERVGQSKLRVLRDGLRFLIIILLSGAFYNPLKCALTGLLLTGTGAVIAIWSGLARSWVLGTLAATDVMIVGAALICHQAVKTLIVAKPSTDTPLERLVHSIIEPRHVVSAGFSAIALSFLFLVVLRWNGTALMMQYGVWPLGTFFLGAGMVLLGISLWMMGKIRDKFVALIDDPFSGPTASKSQA